MDGQPTAAETKHLYQTHPWPGVGPNLTTPRLNTAATPEYSPYYADILPILSQQQAYQGKLLQYNRLLSSGRGGGGGGGLQAPPLPTVLSSPSTKTTTRSRSSSKVSNKDNTHIKTGAQTGHGSRPAKPSDNADRALITSGKDQTSKMPVKKPSEQPTSNGVPVRPPPPASQNGTAHPAQSSSVPSTPHQHARKFSFESREPSPNATQNHSPRSAYSETNGNVPSLRPLPPRLGGCRFETAIPHSRRRMPYNLGTDRLEKGDLERIPSRLSEENEKSLETEMNDLFRVLLPTQEVETKRQKLVNKLEKLFNDEWPGHDIKVHLFGSSGNLLCSDDSDVDICITTPWKGLEHVCLIADLLDRHGMQDVVCISAAKVPIVKIWDPELKLACDMNVNNTLALENTRMVRTYVSIDERVRPLAMIIKHWTRRRIINDAAFGGTLSSYTWICMIIAFLQLRDPPVLPALHQRQKEKLLKSDGTRSEFADDVPKLTGFGAKNKESLAALLFQFFRFYAYEFDYDKFALSIRVGKLLTKTEKKWHIGTNNTLCIEEPFNIIRNLGNTADDTSFRGLHLELRRAFDLLAEGKFAECWEQYVYPKEEERRWEKPSAPPRPVLLRSASQQQSRPQQRNNFNNRSQRNNYQRNGNQGNRRGSNHQGYEQSMPFAQAGMPTTMNPQELVWYQAQNPQIGVPQELLQTSLNALAQHDQNLRFQLYTHAQQINQQQALAHAQRMQGGSGSDRSRTNSFDNPPLTAPIRPDLMYGYGFPMQPPAYFHPGFTTYPSSPASQTSAATTSNGMPEFRRNLRETGVSSGGALRSQSQPASRGSITVQQAMSAAAAYTASQAQNGMSSIPPRQVNGVPVSNYTPDELSETDYEEPKVVADAPEDDGARYAGHYPNGHASPNRKVTGFPSGTPVFNTRNQSSQGRRRLSTDQGPQAVLDRRMKRTSRSPSPLGHARTISAGMSAPLPSAPFAQTNGQLSAKPLVVNGSVPKLAQASTSNRSPLGVETTTTEDIHHSNPLYIQQGTSANNSWNDQSVSYSTTSSEPVSLTVPDRPVIVNGSTANRSPSSTMNHHDASFQQRVTMAAVPTHLYYPHMGYDPNNILGLARLNNRQLAPLDLATNEYSVAQDMPHLSPVYEHRTPSPTVLRSFGPPVVAQSPRGHRDVRSGTQKTPPTGPSAKQHDSSNRSPVLEHRAHGSSRESGNPRSAKSPSDSFNSWQKSKPRKKGLSDLKNGTNGVAQSEQLPKNEADRKGG
ncbi:uncharacterized protein PODANS_1_15710 [Podospora anserina S mat+]|uniref:polynucleotide adenylyltransferase n=1 Tax=Podospora anserina (strain S / ATCC MYA-4624 / DSM 980 / FGSC 10383) TaxID=515849 RepID=B2ATF7_PODAN|nr:uncharacterized protein PODANS_1_15710 [Podospora anserina S mat+]CAP67680.1 unnamed protein product [Podospora anserina S mat+]CDP23939.1 Putative RNA polymerase [Podospora anserina S mat+]